MRYRFCLITAFIFIILSVSLLSSADIVKYEDLDEKPEILQSAQPKYPEEARKKGLVGTAFVEILVDESGKITSSKIKKSSGYKLLDDASIEAAQNFKFSPGKKGGKTVKTQMVIPFKFKLKKECKKKKE